MPRSLHFPGYAIVAPSLLEFGSDEQRELVPAAIRGDTIWCIGMSEPNAGSDLAGLSTRAEVDGDHFVVNGQKVWTSYAMVGAEMLLLRAHRPGRAEAQGHQPPDRRHGHARHRHPAAAAHHRRGGLRRGVLHRRRGAAREPRRVAQRRVAITQGSLAHERAGLWVEGVVAARATDRRARRPRAHGAASIDDPVVRRKLAERYERRRQSARSRLQGVRVASRRAARRPSTRT